MRGYAEIVEKIVFGTIDNYEIIDIQGAPKKAQRVLKMFYCQFQWLNTKLNVRFTKIYNFYWRIRQYSICTLYIELAIAIMTIYHFQYSLRFFDAPCRMRTR